MSIQSLSLYLDILMSIENQFVYQAMTLLLCLIVNFTARGLETEAET